MTESDAAMFRRLSRNLVLIASTLALVSCGGARVSKLTDAEVQQMVAKIDTSTDPDFIYEYDKTKFVPPEGKVLLMQGQTVEGITEYLQAFPDEPLPGGWAAYWAVTEFRGVAEKHLNSTGSSQHHQMLADRFPNAAIHSAMWMVGMWLITERAVKGEFDEVIEQYGKWAKRTQRPIYLRIGYEFDGPHNELDPVEYVAAYHRIVDKLRDMGVDNIAYVWHSYASPTYKGHPISAWYPGDDYVDWVGVSVFEHAYGDVSMGPDNEEVLAFAKAHSKPVMIAETNPVRGISRDDAAVWDEWFVKFFSYIHNKNIKAVSFINENWDRLTIPGIEAWEDARLYNNPDISRAWFEETNKDHYLKASPQLFHQLGYTPE